MARKLIQLSRTDRRFTDKDAYVAHVHETLQKLKNNTRAWKAYKALRPSLLRLKREAVSPDEVGSWLVGHQSEIIVISGTTVMSTSEQDLYAGLYQASVSNKHIVSCNIDSVTLCPGERYPSYDARPYVAAEVELSIVTSTRPRFAQTFQLLGIGNPCEARGWSRQSEPLSLTYALEINLLEWPSLAAQCVWQIQRHSKDVAEPEFFSTVFTGVTWETLCTLSDSGFVPRDLTQFCQWLVQFGPRHSTAPPDLPAEISP